MDVNGNPASTAGLAIRWLGTIISGNRILTHAHGHLGSRSLSSSSGAVFEILRIEGISGTIDLDAYEVIKE